MPTTKKLVKRPENGSLNKQKSLLDERMLKILFHTAQEQGDLIHRIKKRLNSGNPNLRARSVPLLKNLEASGMRLATLDRFYKISLGQQFLFWKDCWDQLPKSFVQAYPEGCYRYIQQRYGVGEQMADMYASVWDAFYSGKHLKPGQIPKYVHLSEVPVAKQRVAAGYVIDGEMTVDRWKALADETLDRSELSREMHKGSDKGKPGRPPNTEEMVLIQETGDLRLYDHGKIEELGYFNIRTASPKGKYKIRQILKRNKIKVRR